MSFASPYSLFMLLAVPAMAVVAAAAEFAAARRLRLLGDRALIERLSDASPVLRRVRAGLLIAALALAVIALARPQFGAKAVQVTRRGSDVVLCVDVSKSMLAEDIKPSRLAAAKAALGDLVAMTGGNRIGIVAFAGTAFWQCPLTLDTGAANLFLQIMDTNLIPLGGTRMGDAVRLALQGLDKSPQGGAAIVLLTDGEDHESDPDGAAAEAAKKGVRIFTIGLGSTNGEPIPVKDEQGGFTGYQKDRSGKVVMSKMDEALLARMAADTGGEYLRAEGGRVDIGRIAAGIAALKDARLASLLHQRYEDRFQIPLFLACVLLIARAFIPERGRRRTQ